MATSPGSNTTDDPSCNPDLVTNPLLRTWTTQPGDPGLVLVPDCCTPALGKMPDTENAQAAPCKEMNKPNAAEK